MESLYKVNSYELFFQKEKSYFLGVWNKESEHLKDKEIVDIISIVTDFVVKLKPRFFLADDIERLSIYTFELQEKIAKIISNGLAEADTRKFAILIPKDLIAELSTDQAVDEFQSPPFETQFFSTQEEALKWFGILKMEKI